MERLAGKVAMWLKDKAHLDEERTEIVEYGIISLLLFVFPLFFILLFCWMLRILSEGLSVALTAAFLRSVTGGAHLSSPYRCIILSTLVPILLGLLGRFLAPFTPQGMMVGILIAAVIWGFYIIHNYAPAEVEEKPLRPERRGVYLRLSFVFAALWALFSAYLIWIKAGSIFLAVVFGYLWQLTTLTPFGFSIYQALSRLGVSKKEGKR